MAGRKLVNLDAMIPRADFAILEDAPELPTKKVDSIGTRDLRPDGLLPLLRKPDFQRETNHWTPEQTVLLIQSFVDEDLIPSVILWQAQGSIFVIDGGHRLSVLRAWIEDDYGDKATSQAFFGFNINENQIKAARETRRLVEKTIGSYNDWIKKEGIQQDLPPADRRRVASVRTTTIPIQWVTGNAERAQASFLKINTKERHLMRSKYCSSATANDLLLSLQDPSSAPGWGINTGRLSAMTKGSRSNLKQANSIKSCSNRTLNLLSKHLIFLWVGVPAFVPH